MMDPVLIIDDEQDNLEAMQRLLRGQYEVTTSSSPFEALKLIQKMEFAVIVSDQRMPEMTGVELLEKAKHVTPLATRILLTGYTDLESVISAINRGNIYRYIAKPWDPEDLKLTLRQASEAYRLRREIDDKNSALTKSNSDLQKAIEALRGLDRAKASFLSLISHELNTPLTILNSFSGILSEQKESLGPELKAAILNITSAGRRFSEIVGEVLTYTKLETENKLECQEFDFNKELKALKKKSDNDLSSKKIEFEIEGKIGPVLCDPIKIRLALEKVVLETVSQLKPGSKIKCTLKEDESGVRCEFWHPGEPYSKTPLDPLGVPQRELNHQKGLGLGLAISRLIMEMHQGEMLFKSGDWGTTYALVFPKRK